MAAICKKRVLPRARQRLVERSLLPKLMMRSVTSYAEMRAQANLAKRGVERIVLFSTRWPRWLRPAGEEAEEGVMRAAEAEAEAEAEPSPSPSLPAAAAATAPRAGARRRRPSLRDAARRAVHAAARCSGYDMGRGVSGAECTVADEVWKATDRLLMMKIAEAESGRGGAAGGSLPHHPPPRPLLRHVADRSDERAALFFEMLGNVWIHRSHATLAAEARVEMAPSWLECYRVKLLIDMRSPRSASTGSGHGRAAARSSPPPRRRRLLRCCSGCWRRRGKPPARRRHADPAALA